jgi:thioester reductase-like protein
VVHCLVRADDQAGAAARLRRNLARYGLWDAAFERRIAAVPGDLAQPLLGLEPELFDRLADTVDLIYHNGALVHFTSPYGVSRAPNVLGTHEALRLAAAGKVKPFQFVSTLGVFHPLDLEGHTALSEEVQPAHGELLATGYTQSKWVAEQLVGLAARRGLPTAIYRLGQVSGHRETGACQTDDFFWQVLKAGTEVGSITPGIVVPTIGLTPVDYVAGAIQHLSRQRGSFGQVFHLHNTQTTTLDVVLEHMARHGFEISLVSPEQWRADLSAAAERDPESTAARLMAFAWDIQAPAAPPELPAEAPEPPRLPQYDCPITLAHLRDTAVALPPPSEQLLDTYIQYFRGIRYFAHQDADSEPAHPAPVSIT